MDTQGRDQGDEASPLLRAFVFVDPGLRRDDEFRHDELKHDLGQDGVQEKSPGRGHD